MLASANSAKTMTTILQARTTRLEGLTTKKYLRNTERPQPPPDSKGGLTISCMPMFRKITTFGHFCQIVTNFRWLNLAETYKRHIYIPRPFVWFYNQFSMTSMTNFEKPFFFSATLANFVTESWLNLAESLKRHIYTPRPFIWPITKSLWPSVQNL